LGGEDEFTSIEQKMIQKMCRLAVQDLKESWRLNYPLELDYLRSESNPHFVGGIHSSETVAVVTFDVEFENLSGTLILILQVKALDPIQQSLSVNITTEVSHEGKLWEKHWKEEIKKIPLDIQVSLGHADTSLTHIKELKKGDVITLQEDAASPLIVKVEGVSKLKGLMGVCRGNTAIRVTDLIESEGGNNG
jgi:flagellar motor switch protein FliM